MFLQGTFLTGRTVARTMVAQGTGGSIVNMASVSSHIAQPAFVPYNASKGAIMQMTR